MVLNLIHPILIHNVLKDQLQAITLLVHSFDQFFPFLWEEQSSFHLRKMSKKIEQVTESPRQQDGI